MYFKKSNKYYEENLVIKQVLEGLSPARACGLALLYMDDKIFSKKGVENKDTKCKLCVFMLYESVKITSLCDEFFGLDDFKHQIGKYCNRNGGWETVDCVLDWMKLSTGKMEFQRRGEILQIVKLVLEEYYELPVGRIVKFISSN